MADNEAFYDAEIAPKLMELMKVCNERGMGLVALVCYDDKGSVARSAELPAHSPAVLRYANAIGKAWCEGGAVNIDSFMMAVMREAREIGHTSAILHQLGVPTKPEGRAAAPKIPF